MCDNGLDSLKSHTSIIYVEIIFCSINYHESIVEKIYYCFTEYLNLKIKTLHYIIS